MKVKVDDQAEKLKVAFYEDLKMQFVTHKKNILDAIESKCYDLDFEMENIRTAMDSITIM